MSTEGDRLLSRLEGLLVEERAAIRRLDGTTVERLAFEKELLVERLVGSHAVRDEAWAARVRAAIVDIRRNGVLLANARDCLRDALCAVNVTVQRPSSPAAPPEARTGARLSVTG